MSGVLSQLLDNKFINYRNSSENIKKILLTKNLKTSKLSLSENNIKNQFYQSSRQNNNKFLRKIKPYKFIKSNFLKNYSNILKNNARNEINNNNDGNSLSFIFNKNNRTSSNQCQNFSEERRNNNNMCSNDNSNLINLSTDIAHNKNSNYFQNEFNLLPIKSFNSYEKNVSKNNRVRDIKIDKIINSLITSSNDLYKSSNNCFNKEETNTNNFPKEKMIDPMYYIKYNLQKFSLERPVSKGINNIIKEITKGSSNKEYEVNLLKRARDISNRKIDVDQLNVPNSENNIYKKKYEDMINQTKHYESFHFNKNSFLQNKIKKYSPYKNILDKTYKFYLENNLEDDKKDNDEKNKNISKRKIKLNLKSNVDKYISFDARVNYILKLSKNTEKNINEKSKVHEKMINEISKIKKNY